MMRKLLPILLLLSSCSPKIISEQRENINTTINTEWRDTTVDVTLPDEYPQ